MASTSPTLTFTWEDLRQAFESLKLNPRQRLIAKHYLDGLEEGYPDGIGPESSIIEIVHIAFGIAKVRDPNHELPRSDLNVMNDLPPLR